MAILSPELRALIERARANPRDDLPKLILADWYDEHGEPKRAELIRVRLALDDLHRTSECGRDPPVTCSRPWPAYGWMYLRSKPLCAPCERMTVLIAREIELEKHFDGLRTPAGTASSPREKKGFVDAVADGFRFILGAHAAISPAGPLFETVSETLSRPRPSRRTPPPPPPTLE
jgi:uncharacterized protein (TIGR02996 family)